MGRPLDWIGKRGESIASICDEIRRNVSTKHRLLLLPKYEPGPVLGDGGGQRNGPVLGENYPENFAQTIVDALQTNTYLKSFELDLGLFVHAPGGYMTSALPLVKYVRGESQSILRTTRAALKASNRLINDVRLSGWEGRVDENLLSVLRLFLEAIICGNRVRSLNCTINVPPATLFPILNCVWASPRLLTSPPIVLRKVKAPMPGLLRYLDEEVGRDVLTDVFGANRSLVQVLKIDGSHDITWEGKFTTTTDRSLSLCLNLTSVPFRSLSDALVVLVERPLSRHNLCDLELKHGFLDNESVEVLRRILSNVSVSLSAGVTQLTLFHLDKRSAAQIIRFLQTPLTTTATTADTSSVLDAATGCITHCSLRTLSIDWFCDLYTGMPNAEAFASTMAPIKINVNNSTIDEIAPSSLRYSTDASAPRPVEVIPTFGSQLQDLYIDDSRFYEELARTVLPHANTDYRLPTLRKRSVCPIDWYQLLRDLPYLWPLQNLICVVWDMGSYEAKKILSALRENWSLQDATFIRNWDEKSFWNDEQTSIVKAILQRNRYLDRISGDEHGESLPPPEIFPSLLQVTKQIPQVRCSKILGALLAQSRYIGPTTHNDLKRKIAYGGEP